MSARLVYLFFIIFVLLGSSNAVNLTDGLDGLGDERDVYRDVGADGADICFERSPLGGIY